MTGKLAERYSAAAAVDFAEQHGVVLVSAKGPAPCLVEAIAGERISGSWWAHPHSKAIYRVLVEVMARDDLLVCRLVDGKVTLVHRKLWPALVRLAEKLAPDRIAQVREEHTASGRHVTRETPFPDWVPAAVLREGRAMSEAKAVALLGRWLSGSSRTAKSPRRRASAERASP